MTEDPQKPAAAGGKGMSRGLRIVLISSLAINLLIAGAVGGAILRHDGPIKRRADLAPAADAGIAPFARAMDRDQRGALGQDIARRNRDLSSNRGDLRRIVGSILETLRTEPFDTDALRQNFTQAQSFLNARQHIGVEALIGQINQMSDEERVKYADRLEHSFRQMDVRR